MKQALEFFGRAGKMGLGLTAGASHKPHSRQLCHPLLQDLDALDPRHRRELTCALSMLWDEFTAKVGGDTGCKSCSQSERTEYITSLRQAAHLVRQNGGPEKLHYALATELMALYAEAAGQEHPSPRDHEMTATIAAAAAQGALIRRAGAGLRAKSRRWDA
jgi:hypothetical protein